MATSFEKIMTKSPVEIAEAYEDAYATYQHYSNRVRKDESTRKLCRENYIIYRKLEQVASKIGYVFENGKAYTDQEWLEHEKQAEMNSTMIHW